MPIPYLSFMTLTISSSAGSPCLAVVKELIFGATSSFHCFWTSGMRWNLYASQADLTIEECWVTTYSRGGSLYLNGPIDSSFGSVIVFHPGIASGTLMLATGIGASSAGAFDGASAR